MIIDDEARKFFSDRTVLEQADELHKALDAFTEDLADRTLQWLEREIKRCAAKKASFWEFRSNRRETPRFIGLGWKGGSKWPPGLRVEFGWNKKAEYGKMPGDAWVGINGPIQLRDKIVKLTRHLFSEAADVSESDSYLIFEYVKNWPDMTVDWNWIDMYPLIEGNGIPFLRPLVSQVQQLATVLG